MDQEIKKQWVEALRSGKYEQGKARLRTMDNKFCCLGVLCDTLGQDWIANPEENCFVILDDCGVELISYLTLDVMLHANLQNRQVERLVELNDFEHKSFEEIADWIEENL